MGQYYKYLDYACGVVMTGATMLARIFLVLPLLVLSACEPAPKLQSSAQHPNIIFILSDDNGIETIRAYGGLDYDTPNLDRLATQGTMFSHAYANQVCHPSRGKLMTGQWGFRSLTFPHFPETQDFYYVPQQNTTTIASTLRDAGYDTYIVGKWHLAGSNNIYENITHSTPNPLGVTTYQAGFDASDITTRDKYYAGELVSHRAGQDSYTRETEKYKDAFLPDILNAKVVEYLKEKAQSKQAFFLYYAMNLPHRNYLTPPNKPKPPSHLGKMQRQKHKFQQMISYMDMLIGNVVNELQQSGLAENTIIIYAGDNSTSAHPPITSRYRTANGKVQEISGGKMSALTEAHKVPFIVWSPMFANNAREQTAMIDFTDLFPSVLDFANVPAPQNHRLDGISFAPLLRGESYRKREEVFMEFFPQSSPFRFVFDKNWKLYGHGAFYNIANDPNEDSPLTNLSPKEQMAYDRLNKRLQQIKQDASTTDAGKNATEFETLPQEQIAGRHAERTSFPRYRP